MLTDLVSLFIDHHGYCPRQIFIQPSVDQSDISIFLVHV